jgi:Hemerythrin HHE cation binding domain
MSTPDDTRDLVDVLRDDHRGIDGMLATLDDPDCTGLDRRRTVDALIAEMVRHGVVEERYLYPTIRRVLPDGAQVAEHGIEDHEEAERDMKRLEGLATADPEFDFVLAKLSAEVRHHMLTEEADLFPRLRVAVNPAELRDLGRRARQLKRHAPTHPHPGAPRRAPASRLVDPAIGLVDRLRDALRSGAGGR